MACAAVPAPQQLQSWLVLAMGNPILQLTYVSHCSSAGFAEACAGPSRALKPHPTWAISTSVCPSATRTCPSPTAEVTQAQTCSASSRTGTWTLSGLPPPPRGGAGLWCPPEPPAQPSRSLLPAPTYRGFPHACSWFRHRFGRFCFNHFSCSSTQRLCSLGLQGELVGDLECLPQREDDLVRQVLGENTENTKLSDHPVHSPPCAQKLLWGHRPSHQQVTSCCVPGKATELRCGGAGTTMSPQGPLPICKAPSALQFSSIKKNSPTVLCNFDSAQV